ncbi:MAG: ankyrin repeat domain-containing protein [Alphaproteobacteria bacterium]|nr:ankyrin repeat domain-containing protein [Alphaproteobacteria bacterium]
MLQRRIFIVILSVFFSVANVCYAVPLSKAEDLTFQTQNDEEFVTDKEGKPFAGAVVLTDENGRDITYFYKAGRKNGVAVAYYENEKPAVEITYAQGKKNGVEVGFSPDGKPQYKKTYKNDVLNGEEIMFYESGNQQTRSVYQDGKLNGEVIYFDENGNQTKIETYVNGEKNGPERFIENKMLRKEYNYVHGELDGVTKLYNEKYLTDEINYKKGKKEGIHTSYKEDGSKIQIPYIEDEKSGEAVAYYPDGKIANKVRFFNNQRNGLSEKFYPNGNLSSAENYKDDLKDGIGRYFNDKGELTSVSYNEKGTELTKVEIENNTDLKNIYEAYKKGQLARFSNKRNFWYLILWLGLNTGKQDILAELEKEMAMFAVSLSDERVYKRYAPARYEAYVKNLYFGLTPLSYAVNINSPQDVLHKLSAQVNEKNAKGTTALQEVVRLGNADAVKYILLHNADMNQENGENAKILLYALENNAPNAVVQELLKAGASANVSDEKGNTPLFWAIKNNNKELIDLLIKNKQGLSVLNSKGQNILMSAYENNAPVEITEQLLQAGVDVNHKDNEGQVLLVDVLKKQDYETAKILLENGADVLLANNEKTSAVSYAMAETLPPDIEKLIFAQDIDANKIMPPYDKSLWRVLVENKRYDLLKNIWKKNPDALFAQDAEKQQPLYAVWDLPENEQIKEIVLSCMGKADDELLWNAIKRKDIELMQAAVAHGADINAVKEGENLLTYIVKNNEDSAFLEVLAAQTLNVDAQNADGQTALDLAVLNNNVAAAEFLLKNGADVNRRVNNEGYLLMLKNNQSEMTLLLLKYKPDFSADSTKEQSLLMKAAARLNVELVNALIKENFDVNARDKNGNTALLYLADALHFYPNMTPAMLGEAYKNIVTLLVDNGADINAQDNIGNTLLMKVAKMKTPAYSTISRVMQELGANPNMRDQYGKTAADYAGK